MRTGLDALTMESAVLGGAILGCGGGGKLEDGLFLGELATTREGALLVDPRSLATEANLAIIVPFHAAGTDTKQIHPQQAHQAFEILQTKSHVTISGLINGGQGAVDSIVGWELSAYTALPLLDAGVPAVYHPIPLRNNLRFLQDISAVNPIILSMCGKLNRDGGSEHILWQGNPTELDRDLINLAGEEIESFVAAVGPLCLCELARFRAFQPVTKAMELGRVLISMEESGGDTIVSSLRRLLPWNYSTFATVTRISWHGSGQGAFGLIELRDTENQLLSLKYSYCYEQLVVNGRRTAVFPDLIVTLGTLGTPLTGEEVFIGQDLYVLVVPEIGLTNQIKGEENEV